MTNLLSPVRVSISCSTIVRTLLVWTYMLCLTSDAQGQTPNFLGFGPNAGIDRLSINPALGAQGDYIWEARVLSGHLFGETDYTQIRNTTLFGLPSATRDLRIIFNQFEIPEQRTGDILVFDEDGGPKSVYARINVGGPSFTYGLQNGGRIGLFTGFRSHLSSDFLPENLGVYELNESFNTNVINIEPSNLSTAIWAEIGAHFSKQVEDLSFGFNFKYMMGLEGAHITSNVTEAYEFVDSIVTVSGAPLYDISFTTGTLSSSQLLSDINGRGIGFDLGFAYQVHNDLLVGIAINDIGVIQYDSNVEIYDPEILADITTVRTQDFRGNNSLRGLIDQFQNDQDIRPDVFGVFSIGLPTRLTLSGDYRYSDKVSISGQLSQRFALFQNSLLANNLLTLVPRYESRNVTVSLPITLYEYSSARLGIALSVGPITIGTDHLTSVFIPGSFDGSDFYFSFNLYPFGGNQNRSRNSRGKEVLCPQF